MTLNSRVFAVEQLVGDGFILDPIQAGDAARLKILSQDEEFRRWLPWIRGGFTQERAREFARDFSRENWASGQPVWAVRIAGELMGVIDLRDRGEDAWEIGFWMHPEARGRGLMTAACTLVVSAAFEFLHATRILHFARIGNDRSRRIARNLGFVPEAVRRKPTPWGVERQWQSALLVSDWKRRGGTALVGAPEPGVLDGARPSELVAEEVRRRGQGASKPTNRKVAPALQRELAQVIYETYSIAAEQGADVEEALARLHYRNLNNQREQ